MTALGIIYIVMAVLTYISAKEPGKKGDNFALVAGFIWPIAWTVLIGFVAISGVAEHRQSKEMKKSPKPRELTIAEQNAHLEAEIFREIDADQRDFEKRFAEAETEYRKARWAEAREHSKKGFCECQNCRDHRNEFLEEAVKANMAKKIETRPDSTCVYCDEIGPAHTHSYTEEMQRRGQIKKRTGDWKKQHKKTDFMGYPMKDTKAYPSNRKKREWYE